MFGLFFAFSVLYILYFFFFPRSSPLLPRFMPFSGLGLGQETLWPVLRAMGYNNNLDLTFARTFVLSMHTEHDRVRA